VTRKTLERLFALGRPFSFLYALVMAFRALCYRIGLFSHTRLSVPVISIGNLTMGGTGKTPMVAYVTALLRNKGWQPVVVCRGYGGKAKGAVNIVARDGEIFMESELAGDEPRLLAETIPGVTVLTGGKKSVVARFADENLHPDVIVVDDGFQHLALDRDIDIVLFSAHSLLGNGRVFPGGDLRESVGALSRANAFVITGIEQSMTRKIYDFRSFLNVCNPTAPIFEGSYEITGLKKSRHSCFLDIAAAKRLKLFAVSAIAQPDSFYATLQQSGFNVAGCHSYRDHHAYGEEDVNFLYLAAQKVNAEALITTEKDYVKLHPLWKKELPLMALQRTLQLDKDFEHFLFDRLSVGC